MVSVQDKENALSIIASTLVQCEKMRLKFPPGSSQHTLLVNRIQALSISKALLNAEEVAKTYSQNMLKEALTPLRSVIHKCQAGQKKHSPESPTYQRLQKMIDGMDLSVQVVLERIQELEQFKGGGLKMDTQYILFLRGVNVGGKNKVTMALLKRGLETAGYQNVLTYINSGNLLVIKENTTSNDVKTECEAIIREIFQLDIPVCVIPLSDYEKALQNIPSWWGKEPDSKHNAIFVLSPWTAEAVIQEVGAIKPEYEQLAFYGNVIFWSASFSGFSRTRWSKVAGTKAYEAITIRNANTTLKMLELAKKM